MDALRQDPSMEFPALPAARPGAAERAKNRPAEETRQEEKTVPKPKRPRDELDAELGRGRAATIAVICCCVAAMVAVVIFLVMLANGGLFNPETITYQVPELIGNNFESLQPIEGITVIKQGESYSDQYPAGTILDQLPVAGTQVEPGRTVFVTVSLGPKPPDVTMPAVAGKTETEAKEILDALQMDLNIAVKEIYHDTVPEGMVIGAEVKDDISSTDQCLRNFAVRAARLSRFSQSSTAPARQTGEIVYRFIAQ
jgi:hypothetical protein